MSKLNFLACQQLQGLEARKREVLSLLRFLFFNIQQHARQTPSSTHGFSVRAQVWHIFCMKVLHRCIGCLLPPHHH